MHASVGPWRTPAEPCQATPFSKGRHPLLLVFGFLDLLEPHRPARPLSDPAGEGGRPVLLRNAVLIDVAVEVVQPEGRVLLSHS